MSTQKWTHGVGLYGLLKFHEITGDKEALDIALAWFRDRFEIGTTKNVNTMAPLLTAAYLHEAKHASYGVHLDSWAEWVMHEMPRTEEGGLQHITYLVENHQQLWDDTLMMSVLPLAKIGLVLDRPEYIEEAKRQFMLHVKYLADPQTGLWFHGACEMRFIAGLKLTRKTGWTFEGRHNFARARWARGNCWITVAIPDFIELLKLSPTDGLRMFLVSTLQSQIDALVRLQDANTGLWHTILDDPSSYLEASATAGFAYGILKSLRTRLIPREERYVLAAQKAVKGIMDNITEKGELKQVSFGTPVFDNAEEYKKIALTSMPYGQSLALLALTEHLRTFL
ncbi:glycoside hydrolase family 105 protein [Amylostereum chailletii]|nr:glycoside hydrolase family 105 protein [Amylostereum chailletii]